MKKSLTILSRFERNVRISVTGTVLNRMFKNNFLICIEIWKYFATIIRSYQIVIDIDQQFRKDH